MEDIDKVYWERNQLVAHLSKLYHSWITHDDGHWWIVYMDTPKGQLSWHFHVDDMADFNHLVGEPVLDVWDGHTTEEKYERLRALGAKLQE